MAKVKIYLDKGETQRDAEDSLLKALTHHNSGEAHSEQKFDDPAMDSVAARMEESYKKISQEMIQEITEVLDEDYLNSYGN